jgi:dipeptide/tripeptide permease
MLDRWLGTKVDIASGLMFVAGGLWRLTTTTTTQGFGHALVGMVLLGLGAGLIIAPATASVMAALPRERSGVGSATNSALQVGGALGVAVIGSVLSTRYQAKMTSVLAGHSLPAVAGHAILGTLGAALTVGARHTFIDGMDLSLAVGAVVVVASAVLVIFALPARRKNLPDAAGVGSALRLPIEGGADDTCAKRQA